MSEISKSATQCNNPDNQYPQNQDFKNLKFPTLKMEGVSSFQNVGKCLANEIVTTSQK
jgi:hypothetical protein